eukprot:TRINITY_DN971_c0_g1_i2.p1 TRINITY_DN971_c0_g1~~TRINITY_DN971_c0_g1_i2.p1  ORF type:complete len:833 (-),score=208.41 TRINITY_DN971_c0_g1_i2:251-2749(-)
MPAIVKKEEKASFGEDLVKESEEGARDSGSQETYKVVHSAFLTEVSDEVEEEEEEDEVVVQDYPEPEENQSSTTITISLQKKKPPMTSSSTHENEKKEVSEFSFEVSRPEDEQEITTERSEMSIQIGSKAPKDDEALSFVSHHRVESTDERNELPYSPSFVAHQVLMVRDGMEKTREEEGEIEETEKLATDDEKTKEEEKIEETEKLPTDDEKTSIAAHQVSSVHEVSDGELTSHDDEDAPVSDIVEEMDHSNEDVTEVMDESKLNDSTEPLHASEQVHPVTEKTVRLVEEEVEDVSQDEMAEDKVRVPDESSEKKELLSGETKNDDEIPAKESEVNDIETPMKAEKLEPDENEENANEEVPEVETSNLKEEVQVAKSLEDTKSMPQADESVIEPQVEKSVIEPQVEESVMESQVEELVMEPQVKEVIIEPKREELKSGLPDLLPHVESQSQEEETKVNFEAMSSEKDSISESESKLMEKEVQPIAHEVSSESKNSPEIPDLELFSQTKARLSKPETKFETFTLEPEPEIDEINIEIVPQDHESILDDEASIEEELDVGPVDNSAQSIVVETEDIKHEMINNNLVQVENQIPQDEEIIHPSQASTYKSEMVIEFAPEKRNLELERSEPLISYSSHMVAAEPSSETLQNDSQENNKIINKVVEKSDSLELNTKKSPEIPQNLLNDPKSMDPFQSEVNESCAKVGVSTELHQSLPKDKEVEASIDRTHEPVKADSNPFTSESQEAPGSSTAAQKAEPKAVEEVVSVPKKERTAVLGGSEESQSSIGSASSDNVNNHSLSNGMSLSSSSPYSREDMTYLGIAFFILLIGFLIQFF